MPPLPKLLLPFIVIVVRRGARRGARLRSRLRSRLRRVPIASRGGGRSGALRRGCSICPADRRGWRAGMRSKRLPGRTVHVCEQRAAAAAAAASVATRRRPRRRLRRWQRWQGSRGTMARFRRQLEPRLHPRGPL